MYWSSERYGGENGSDHAEVFYRRTAWYQLSCLSGRIENNSGSP